MQQTIIKPYKEDSYYEYGPVHRDRCDICHDSGVEAFLDKDTRWLLCSCEKGRTIGIEHGRIAMEKASLIGLEENTNES